MSPSLSSQQYVNILHNEISHQHFVILLLAPASLSAENKQMVQDQIVFSKTVLYSTHTQLEVYLSGFPQCCKLKQSLDKYITFTVESLLSHTIEEEKYA